MFGSCFCLLFFFLLLLIDFFVFFWGGGGGGALKPQSSKRSYMGPLSMFLRGSEAWALGFFTVYKGTPFKARGVK